MRRRDGLDIAARVREAMAARCIRARGLAKGLPHRHYATMYRLLSGATSDPRTSTVVDICRVLSMEPDALLGTAPMPLEPEVQELFDDALTLADRDKWFVVDLVRSLRRRGLEDRDGQGSQGSTV